MTESTTTDATYTTVCDSPVGPLTIIAGDDGLRAVLMSDGAEQASASESSPENPVLVAAVTQLEEYFRGSRQEFDVPLDPVGTEFQQSAWQALRTIPFGETVSYGEQAERMGDKRKARAVGAANGRNPISIIVPCHRVVGSDGSLTGYAGGVDTKAWLLRHEARVAGTTLL